MSDEAHRQNDGAKSAMKPLQSLHCWQMEYATTVKEAKKTFVIIVMSNSRLTKLFCEPASLYGLHNPHIGLKHLKSAAFASCCFVKLRVQRGLLLPDQPHLYLLGIQSEGAVYT